MTRTFPIFGDLRLNADFAGNRLANARNGRKRSRRFRLCLFGSGGSSGIRFNSGGSRNRCGSSGSGRRSDRSCLRHRSCWCEHQANCDQGRSQLLHYLFVHVDAR
jgi:hypothetical protein